jgi:hypothetical protein
MGGHVMSKQKPFADRYQNWKDRVFEQFKADYPELEKIAFQWECCENGDVFVHLEKSSYPIKLSGFESWEDQ